MKDFIKKEYLKVLEQKKKRISEKEKTVEVKRKT